MREPSGDHDGDGRPQGERPGLRTKAAALLLLKIVVSLSFAMAVILGIEGFLFSILAVAGRMAWRMLPLEWWVGALLAALLALPLRHLETRVERRRRQVENELQVGRED